MAQIQKGERSMVRIVVVGANGQVASEVVLLLRRLGGIQVLPVVRTHGGSAFLRYCGVPVAHGAITDPATAPRLLAGADVVANFALASGTPSETLSQNDRIIHATFDYAPRDATIVFFSTLAVDGSFTEDGQRQRNAYGDIKLRNERLVEKLAASSARRAFILRLGHVAGSLQGITDVVRRDIASPPAVLPDPDRHSNLTYTAAIADALDAIATGRASAPGKYDLVNVPQWTWREIYQWEADAMGASLHLERCVLPTTTQSARGLMRSVVGGRKPHARQITQYRFEVMLDHNNKPN